MAHTQSGGSTKLGRESHSKRLGIKIFDGQPIKVGQIVARQRGTKYFPGRNVKIGGDDTLFALRDGIVKFSTRFKSNFAGKRRRITVVNVV